MDRGRSNRALRTFPITYVSLSGGQYSYIYMALAFEMIRAYYLKQCFLANILIHVTCASAGAHALAYFHT